jgi:hypothetical protein
MIASEVAAGGEQIGHFVVVLYADHSTGPQLKPALLADVRP